MGLITEIVTIKWNGKNKLYYEKNNYIFTKFGDEFKVKVEDLTKGSHALIEVKCDCCGKELKNIKWVDYLKCVKEDGKYYCNKCARKLYAGENGRLTRLRNGRSFEQWCIDNNRQDILDRWDFELNDCKPSEITHGSSSKKYYFKCPRELHESELKNINAFTNGQEGSISCNQCNSFAQWGIDNICENFLELYWDYDKNVVDPWEISYGSKNKVYIICQEKYYHGSYKVSPGIFFSQNTRCPYCSTLNGKVHSLDSLGKLLEDRNLLHLWSDKNNKSPYKYTPFSVQKVYWKCPEGKHEDYLRQINNSNTYNFRCPECQYSKGEVRISNYFANIGFIKINNKDYRILETVFKEKYDYYIPQKDFNGLVGLNNGLLTYDFYLPNYIIAIEYQGIQHYEPVDFAGKGEEWAMEHFKITQEHDKRKRDYCINNNIKLIEIPYWDFNNIENILNRVLNINMEELKYVDSRI